MNESLIDLMKSGTTSSIGQKSCLGCFFIPHAEQIEIMQVLQNESMGRWGCSEQWEILFMEADPVDPNTAGEDDFDFGSGLK